jgi:nitrogen fixation/metabolism regulation signal transduction histidine kinase
MAFKNYQWETILLSLFIGLLAILGAYALIAKWWISTIFFYTLVIILIFRLVSISQKLVTKLEHFFNSLKFEDYTVSVSEDFQTKEFMQLNKSLSQIADNFREMNFQKERNLFYLQHIIEHIDIGILAFNLEGKIVLINKALKTSLGIKSIDDVFAFQVINADLFQAIEKITPFERLLIHFVYNENTYKLALYATSFSFDNEIVKLVSFKNIRSELERQELDSWQKLISVLTHEIMNSIAPISSLSQTLDMMLSQVDIRTDNDEISMDKEIYLDTKEALKTIHKRSDGLIHFVQTYRNITKIPMPVYKLFAIEELFQNVTGIFKTQTEKQSINIESSIQPLDLEISADISLIEQVLINLLKNAIQATRGIENPQIKLSALINTTGNIEIQVEDNGPGILPEVLDKIFIPFFTTKTDGSGIGLSLSRQIVNYHGGSLTVFSEPNVKTIFKIII